MGARMKPAVAVEAVSEYLQKPVKASDPVAGTSVKLNKLMNPVIHPRLLRTF